MAKITTGQMFEQWEQMNQKLEALDNKINGIIDGSTPANTQLTGSNVEDGLPVEDISNNIEMIYSETEFTCPANSFKLLDYIDVSKFKDFFIHFVPNGLAEYSIYYYIKRPNGFTLTRRKVTDISTSSNGVTDRFTINSITSAIAIENKTDIDHVFGEIWLFGVRR